MSTRTSRGAADLRRYFHSGWAFLIPYLAVYLLYYWLKWPVNPPAAAGVGSSVPGSSFSVPSLLHVYWFLHAINVGLAAVALVSWWREQGKGDRSQILDGLTPRRDGAKEQTSGILQKETEGIATRGSEGSRKIVPFLVRFRAFLRLKKSAQPAAPLSSLPPVKSTQEGAGSSENEGRSPSRSLSFSFKIAPWVLLGLLFWIPGVYLEYPADPWEHYGRINQWSWLHLVGEHSAWDKSSYFLAYSLLGQVSSPTRQLFWLDFYYTGACLLLCWQYYRLARAVGLGERAAFVFVLVQAFTFGNNIFGFYRYYGISSSIFAQLGAVALVRVAIEYANQKFQVPSFKFQGTPAEILQKETEGMGPRGFSALRFKLKALGSAQPGTPTAHEGIASEQAYPAASSRPKALGSAPSAVRSRLSARSFPRFPGFPLSAFQAAFCAACLLALTAFNHVQGIGIAGLGLLAVLSWRLIEWKRSMVIWLAAAAIALSVAAILWWPRNPALDAAYRPAGWLTAWYGFNLFSPSSLAFDRTVAILGFFGLVNILAGLFLLRWNHVVAWLTTAPLFAFYLPFVAIPFANTLATRSQSEILTFHRMLLAIPSGLALVALAESLCGSLKSSHDRVSVVRGRSKALQGVFDRLQIPAFALFVGLFAALPITPASAPYCNRLWNALMVSPGDLDMSQARTDLKLPNLVPTDATASTSLFTTPGIGLVAYAAGTQNVPLAYRPIYTPVVPAVLSLVNVIASTTKGGGHGLLLMPRTWALITPVSHAGHLSHHWLPQEVALQYAAGPEIQSAARELGGKEINNAAGALFLFGEWKSGTQQGR